MPRPTARVLALLEILEAGGTRTVAELADRLGVDERTVRRYVDHLIDLDIPVHSVRGRYGGYRLAPGYRMPPLMFNDEEALAVLLSLIAGQRAGLVPTSADATDRATAKVRRVLPQALARQLDALLATVEFSAPGRAVTSAETATLLVLADAVRQRRPVAIHYTAWSGQRSDRTVHPYGLVVHSGRWYLTGADSASGDVRTFRLDRMDTVSLLAGSFEVPEGFDPTDRVLSGLARIPHLHEVSVRVQGSADHIRHRLPAGLATVVPLGADDGDAWARVQLRAERLEWVPSVLASLDRPFVIEHPEELREHVRALARRLDAAAQLPP